MREDVVRGYSWDSDYGFVTPRLGVSYDASDRVNLYATLSTARSEPRFDDIWNPQDVFQNPVVLFERYDPATRRLSDAKARPERLTAAEAGVTLQERQREPARERVLDGLSRRAGLRGRHRRGRAADHRQRGALAAPRRGAGALAAAAGRVGLDGQRLRERGPARRTTCCATARAPPTASTTRATGSRCSRRGWLEPASRGRSGRCAPPSAFATWDASSSTTARTSARTPRPATAPGYVPKTIEPFTLWEAELQLDLGRWLKRGGRTTLLPVSADNLFDARYTASGYVDDQPYFVPAATRNIYLGLRVGF